MDRQITLVLPKCAVFQILDGLRERAEIWECTEEYMDTGCVHEPYCIEECSNAEEAHGIAEHYNEIIQLIEKQLQT